MKHYDFLIVGAGLFGSICARELTDKGLSCLVIDKRNHIGGNCYTENVDGINVHKYGPHIFHTNNSLVWEYINRFCNFNFYTNRTKVNFRDKIYSFPINLFTLYQLWGCKSPTDAKKIIELKKVKVNNPTNLEEWAVSQIGEELYQIFFYGYTKKQWGVEPKELPMDIIKRIPIRFNFNDNYFQGQYQGIPIGGYTNIFKQLLKGIDVQLNTNWNDLKNVATNTIFSGKIDEFFDFKFGKLEFRSLYFEEELLDTEDFQGNAIINYTDINVPFTRIVEHKHFEFGEQKKTVITKEYPSAVGESFYPINNEQNNKVYNLYFQQAEKLKNVYFGGRLGTYKYMDMDVAILNSLNLTKKITK